MPLKKSEVKMTTAKVVEGNPVRSEGLMSLFSPAKLPLVTLNVEQFAFPKTFLVVEPAQRRAVYVKNPETGWDLKDSNGNKTKTGKYCVQLKLASGDVAQTLVDQGLALDGLTTVDCFIDDDLPVQEFEPKSTLVKLVKPVVMLGFGGQSADRIILRAEGCELV